MTHPPAPSQPDPVDEENFEQALADVERSLLALQARYQQIQSDRQQQDYLQQRREEVRQELHQHRNPQLRQQLRQIEEQLETIELNLESSLFSWGSLKEPFWQAVRFGGLGIVVGWILRSCAG